MLLCFGSRCWIRTKAIPESGGIWVKNWSKASKPPADAPIPTMGKEGVVTGTDETFCFLVSLTTFLGLEVALSLGKLSGFFIGMFAPPNQVHVISAIFRQLHEIMSGNLTFGIPFSCYDHLRSKYAMSRLFPCSSLSLNLSLIRLISGSSSIKQSNNLGSKCSPRPSAIISKAFSSGNAGR